ncbi:hypothetical protein [Methylobacterium radiotolerans]|uniref:hypothetical protein n=1 Tax=Methylobacterium radiotolerans TaxID=31998 RepID=UPI0015F42882|nr:hypothetical protein [Methylobacterium radiotolerans]
MLPSVHMTDLLGLGFLIIGLVGAGIASANRSTRFAEEPREELAGGALLVAILGLAFVLAE